MCRVSALLKDTEACKVQADDCTLQWKAQCYGVQFTVLYFLYILFLNDNWYAGGWQERSGFAYQRFHKTS